MRLPKEKIFASICFILMCFLASAQTGDEGSSATPPPPVPPPPPGLPIDGAMPVAIAAALFYGIRKTINRGQ